MANKNSTIPKTATRQPPFIHALGRSRIAEVKDPLLIWCCYPNINLIDTLIDLINGMASLGCEPQLLTREVKRLYRSDINLVNDVIRCVNQRLA